MTWPFSINLVDEIHLVACLYIHHHLEFFVNIYYLRFQSLFCFCQAYVANVSMVRNTLYIHHHLEFFVNIYYLRFQSLFCFCQAHVANVSMMRNIHLINVLVPLM